MLNIVRDKDIPRIISMSELGDAVGPLPPPIKTNLKAFLHRYPEKVNIYCDCSGYENVYWVQETTHPRMLPRFEEFPVDIGVTPRFQWADFDWDQYRDIDDMYKEETLDAALQRDEDEETEADREVRVAVSTLLSDMMAEIEEAEGEGESGTDEGNEGDENYEGGQSDGDGDVSIVVDNENGPGPPSESSQELLVDDSSQSIS